MVSECLHPALGVKKGCKNDGTDGDGERETLSCKELKHGKQDMLQASSQIMVGIVDVLLDRVDGDVELLGNLPLLFPDKLAAYT